MDVPLFPLHTVLCPGIALPLHIFEPRYRTMVQRCLADDAPFGVVWIRDGHEVGSGTISIASVGTLAEIREADRLADGRYDLIAVGTSRFRVEQVFTDREPYLIGRVEPVEDVVADETRTRRLSKLVTRRFVRYVTRVRETAGEDDDAPEDPVAAEVDAGLVPSEPGASDASGPDPDPAGGEQAEPLRLAMPADPTLLSFLLAGIVEVDLPHRQALLEADTTDDRLVDLADVLAREVAYLEQQLRVFTPDRLELAARRN